MILDSAGIDFGHVVENLVLAGVVGGVGLWRHLVTIAAQDDKRGIQMAAQDEKRAMQIADIKGDMLDLKEAQLRAVVEIRQSVNGFGARVEHIKEGLQTAREVLMGPNGDNGIRGDVRALKQEQNSTDKRVAVLENNRSRRTSR